MEGRGQQTDKERKREREMVMMCRQKTGQQVKKNNNRQGNK